MEHDIQEALDLLAANPGDAEALALLEGQCLEARRLDVLVQYYERWTAGMEPEAAQPAWSDLSDRLERSAEELEEPEAKAEALYLAGELCNRKLGRPDKAMVLFQQAFRTWTGLTQALDSAREIYRAQDNHRMVVRLYELQAQVTDDPAEAAELHFQAGQTLMEALGDREGAADAYARALELQPGHPRYEEALAFLEAVEQNWEKVVQRFIEEASGATDPTLAGSLYLRAAETLLEHDGEREEVLRLARLAAERDPQNEDAAQLVAQLTEPEEPEEPEAATAAAEQPTPEQAAQREARIGELTARLQENPADEPALAELAPLLAAAGRLAELGEIAEDALRRIKRGPQEEALVRTVARIHWRQRKDMEAAEKVWRRVKLAAPRDEEMLGFYAELYEREEDYKRLLSVLASLQAVQAAVPDKVATGRRMAAIAEDKLGNHEKAIDIWKSVARIAPDEPEVRQSLKRLFRVTEKWNALLEYYKEEIAALPAGAVEDKVAIHKEMLAIYQDHLHLDVMVINTYNAILQIDPTNSEALDALAERYEKAARWNDLIGVLKRKSEIEQDPDALVELLRRTATLYLERFSNQAQAVKPLEQILEMRPEDRDTLHTLKDIYRQRRSWKQLLSVLIRETETVTGEARATLLEEAATLAQERLNQPDQAISLWQARLAMAEGALPAQTVEALDGLYSRGKHYEELTRLLQLQLERLPAGSASCYPILCRLGRLLVSPLDRQAEAIRIWREALAMAPPGDAEPRQALEQLYRQAEAWDELEDLLAAASDQAHLADLLERAARSHAAVDVRAALWQRVIRIASGGLADENRVLRAREALLELEPENIEVVRELVPVYRQRSAWSRLSDMLEILLQHEKDGPSRRALYEQLWGLHEQQIGDTGVAFRWCGKAFSEFPGPDTEAELVRLASKTDAWESLVLIGRAVARELQDPDYRLSLQLTLGGICMTRLGWVEEAIGYFSQALTADPESRVALEALEKLYARTEQWPRLLEVLERSVPLAGDDAQKIAIHFRIAQINEESLDAPQQAIEAFIAVLDLDATNAEALAGLERLYTALAAWPKLAEVVQRQVALAAAPAAKADRLFLLARIHEEHLDELSRSVDLYAELLALDAEHADGVAHLEALLERGVEALRVAALLEPVYRARGDWRRLAGVLDVLRSGERDPLRRVALLKEVAGLAEEKLDELPRAFARLLEAFGLSPEDRSLWDELDRLASTLQRWDELAEAFAAGVEGPAEALGLADRLELALRVAEVREKQDRLADAARAYHRALELDESSSAAILALERLHAQLGEWSALVEILERKAALADGDAERCAILGRICTLQEHELADPATAIQTYLRILDIDPVRIEPWLALERLYDEARRYGELAALLVRLIEVQGDSPEGSAARYRLGQVQEAHLGDPLAAVESYREVLLRGRHDETVAALQLLLIHPPDGVVAPEEFIRTITEILEQVYLEPGEEPNLIRILDRRLGVSHDPEEQVELLVRIAELHGKLEAMDPAFDALARALAVAPQRGDVAEKLHALAGKHDKWPALVLAIEEALATGPEPEVCIELLRQAATVSIEQLQRIVEAEGFLRRILELDPADAAALDELERCLRRRGDHEAVVEVLRQKVKLADDPAVRIELLHQVGEVLDLSLDRPDEAIEAYRSILAIDERETRALDALERILEGGERWADLIPVLAHRVECVDTVEQRKRLHARIAAIWDARLGEADEAISAWRAILDLDADDRAALAELDRLYEREQRWVDLLDVLQRRVELSVESQERAALQLRQGHLLADRLGDPERAIECFREVLEGAPKNEGARQALEKLLADPEHRSRAAEVLEPFYLELEAFEPLRDSLEIRLLDQAEPDARLELTLRIAEICELKLGDRNAAFDAMARAFSERRSDPRPVEGLHRLADSIGRWADLVAILQAGAEEELDTAVVKDLRLRVARILHHEVVDMRAAQQAYRRVLEVDGEEAEALDSLEAIYASLGAHEELLDIYRTKVTISRNDDERIGLLLQIARVQRDILERPQGAIEALRQVLSLREDHAEANSGLTALLTFEARWAELADHLLRRLSLSRDPAEGLRLKFDLGRLYMDRLDNAAGAIGCFREVLEEQPGHKDAIAALESYLQKRVEVEAVADILEPIYRQQQLWPKVVEVATARREATDDPLRRGELALQIARIQEKKLRDSDAAFTILSAALTETPDQIPLRVELERLADEVGGWFEVVELLERLVGQVTDPDAALAMRRSLARACDERLNDYGRARAHWELVFELDENDAEAVESLERIFTRTEEWTALVDLYLRRADRSLDAREKIAILGKVCNLYEEVLEDPEQAIGVYRQILDVDPEHAGAVRGLDRLLNLLERWEELAELLMRQAELCPELEEQIAVRHRLAVLLHEHLGRTGDSIDTFRNILLDVPGHAGAIRSMEGLLAGLTGTDTDAIAYRQQLCDLLEPYYVEREDWPRLVGLLDIRFGDAEYVPSKVALLRQIAEVQERRMREPGRAFSTLCQAMGLDFGNTEVSEELDRLAEELNAWDRLINVYIDGLEGVEEHEIAVAMLLKLAQIFDHRLHHVPNAVECYRRLLTLEEGHSEALDALERLYAGAGAHEQLVGVLTEKAKRAEDPVDKKELWYRICEIWDEVLNDRHQAIAAYRTLLELDSEDLVAIDALERLYRATGDWPHLVEIYRQKVTLASDMQDQIQCLFEIATLEDESLGDADAAIEACRQVLDLDPVNPRAFGTLQTLFKREQRWSDLLQLLEQALGIATTPAAMDAIQMQIGELQVTELDAVEDAIETFRTILDRTERHEGALAALEKLLARPAHREHAARVLEPQYEAAGNWNALVRILDVQREECPDTVGRVELLQRMARLHEHELGNRRAAFECLGQALREDPLESELLGELERLVRALDDLPSFAQLLTEVLEKSDDSQVQRDLSRRLARLYDLELGSGEQAVPHYRRLLTFDELDGEALAALDRIYGARSAWNELLEVLERRVGLASGDEATELRFRLGELLEEVFGRIGDAVEQYRQILWEKPGHGGARAALDRLSAAHEDQRITVQEVLEPIYWSEEAFGELVKLFERRLPLAGSPAERASLHLQVGDLLEHKLGEERRAFEHYRAALSEDPGDGLALENMRRLVDRLGAWRELADSMSELLQRIDDPLQKRDLTLQLAAIQREQLHDDAAAEAGYLTVLAEEPENPTVLTALEAIYRAGAQVAKLVGILRRRVAIEFDPLAKIAMLREVATLAAAELADPAMAEQAYREMLELDESDDAALRALEQLVEARGDKEELIRVLERRVSHALDSGELMSLHQRLGRLALELGRPGEAIERYRSCLDMDPTNEELLATLQDLYAQAEQWDEVKVLLVQRLSGAEEEDRRVEHLMALATLAETRFTDLEEAEGYVRQVLELRPEDAEAGARLEELLHKLERWWDLVDLYRERAREAKDPAVALDLLLRVSKLALEKLQEMSLAKEVLQEVLAVAPDNPEALDGLVRLYEADADWERCLEVLDAQLAKAVEPARLADLLFHKGSLLAEKLDRIAEAVVVLPKALEHQPSHKETLALLKELYRRQEDWESYVGIISFQEKLSESQDERFALLKEQAEIYQDKLNDPMSAVLALEQANELRPGDTAIMRPLVDSYLAAKEWDKAKPLLESLVAELREGRKFRELPRLLHRLGLVSEQLGQKDEALAHYKAAHDLDATYLPNLLDLGRAYFQRSDWQSSLKVFQTMLLHQSELKNVQERVDVFFHLGMVRKALGDGRRAKDMFQRALALDPKHQPSQQAMAELS